MARIETHAAPHLGVWKQAVSDFLQSRPGLPDLAGFATSGSSGGLPKMILFTPAALTAAARGAVRHFGAHEGDWCCPLPDYHVGGDMIYRRARLAGTCVHALEGRWNPAAFARLAHERHCAWSSLVPAQVVDLVREGVEAPDCLRGIVVGGGRLDRETGLAARRLGWPVAQSYGMTEAGSQVATVSPGEPFENDWLPLLPHWKASMDADGLLCLEGEALFHAIVHTGIDGRFVYEPRDLTRPWKSRDLVELKDGKLRFVRRRDRVVKIVGELVDLDAVEADLAREAPGCAVVELADTRRGWALAACGENGPLLRGAVDRWNRDVPGFMRVAHAVETVLPRNAMGKLDRVALRALAARAVSE